MNPELNAEYWNQRYLTNNFGWDIGAVSDPLKAYIDQLENKQQKILIPGAGNAYEAEYLIEKGFTQVYVCDFAETALQNLKTRCPQLSDAQLLLSDFFELKENNFDLVLEQTFFCALNPSLRTAYFQKMHQIIKPGGKLVGLLFDHPMNNDQPPYGGDKEEYRRYFKGLFLEKTYAPSYNSIKPREGKELFIHLQRI